MEKYAKEKKIIVIGAILLVLTLTIGATYSLWNYFKVGENQQLVAGEIYMKYTESSNTINIQNAMPTSTYDPSQVFEFTIEGKNTYSKPIWYEIVISWGEEAENRHTRIPDKFIRFRLTEQLPGGEETEVIKAGKYSDFENGKKIWVNTIAANTRTDTKITYKLYMWVSSEMHLGAGDDASSSDMDMTTWNTDAFASVKVSVNGDFTPKELDKPLGTEIVKETLGQTGGVVGVTNTNTKVTQESSNIREYRYSGTNVNNYVYFNCQDNMEQNGDNCETWRIIGVFKDENNEEHLKIVRNEVLTGVFPETYVVGGKNYYIKGELTSGKLNNFSSYKVLPLSNAKFMKDYSENSAYWNWNDDNYYNDWTTAGLQYWLNSKGDEMQDKGYLNSLYDNAKNMIAETKYYLGNFNYNTDTSALSYEHERESASCSMVEEEYEECSGGDIWSGNQANWSGSVALMYPSDYGFSADSTYWNETTLGEYYNEAYETSWLTSANHDNYEWFLSPSSFDSGRVAGWNSDGDVGYVGANLTGGVRPALYLKSTAIIDNGDGTSLTPYALVS